MIVAVACAIAAAIVGGPADSVIEVRGPTVIAFFRQSEAEDGEPEPLGDFQFYAAQAQAPLAKHGVAFHVIYPTGRIAVRIAGQRQTLRPKVGVGYYFLAPGRRPRLQHGVVTDDDLLALVQRPLGVQVRRVAP